MGQLERVIPDVTTRRLKIEKTAKAHGLDVTFGSNGSLITFTKPDTRVKETMWGLWCAETFLKGYAFAQSEFVPKEKHGLWKDKDPAEEWGQDWEDSDDD